MVVPSAEQHGGRPFVGGRRGSRVAVELVAGQGDCATAISSPWAAVSAIQRPWERS